ncbi:fibronectin type III domain-containing protein [Lacinutrix sp. C3R15]|uniref:GEVED domain-containing protein n=1 Tax=Flavobacteriaceae TaxID=49546 RepID=UPI001C09288A|nr:MULTISPECIES: GEVED domain-containing protein [Flavobacteriaceae]MBU2938164.1 fibronectin type III domain-containing protein [Lacinutrix sp. C3R15]MDO6621478.1 GEVED domain-containing protein [Oceanihabitans sp. 1_MG-2023]
MKKNLLNLLIVLMLAMSWHGMAQEVEIGYGTSIKSYPLGTSYLYERSSTIYTSSEIGTTGTIYRIAWNASYGERAARPIKIYLRETSDELQTGVTWASKIAGATVVYDEIVNPITGWNYFVLTTPFSYSGNNLEVMVEANYGDMSTNPYGLTKYAIGSGISYTLKTNSHARWSQDFGAPTGTGTVDNRRPNITIDFGGVTCSSVTNVTTVNRADTTADISWESDSFGTSWNISWGSPGFTPGGANEIGSDVSITTDYQITGLTDTTAYEYYIQTDCGASYVSDWAGPFSFNTRCVAPTDLVANNYDVADTTAQVSWTAGDVETAWNISWGPNGYAPGDANEVGRGTSTTTSYTITGLMEQTYYDFYIQADCGGGDVGVWSERIGFTTDCTYIDYLYENFDAYDISYSISEMPDCWVRLDLYGFTDDCSYGIRDNSSASGTQSLQLHTPSSNFGIIGVLPSFSNVNAGTHWLRFKAKVSNADGLLYVGYVTNERDWGDFTIIESLNITNDSWDIDSEYIVLIPETIPSNAKLAIKSMHDNENYFIDDLYWEPIPSCTPPADLVTTDIGINTVSFSWEEIPDSLYNLRYREVGSTTWTTIYDIPTNTYDLSGLKQYTEYEVSVSSNCVGGDPSIFLTTIDFMTGGFYCYSEVSQPRDYYYISRVGLNTIDNSSSYSAYTDFTDISTNLVAGDTYSIFITVTADNNYNTSYGVWIDYNADGVYDSEERVFATNMGSNVPAAGTFTVPEDVISTTTSMRVSMRNGSSIPQPCEDYSIGEVEEYTINLQVQGAPSCEDSLPENIVIQDVSHTTATVNWTVTTAPAEGYVVEVYETGASQGVDTPVFIYNVDSSNLSSVLSGLSLGTTYDVYVISECDSDTNIISDVNTFTTSSCDAVTGVTITTVTHNSAVLYWTASANASEGYQVNVYEQGATTPFITGTVAASTTAVNLTNLSPETTYEVEVISYCDTVSTTSSKINFTTGVDMDTDYCDSTIYTVESITRVLFAGIDNASTAVGASEYEDFSAIVGQVETGATYGFSAEGYTDGNFTNYFTVWIDWNQDFEFQTEEMYEIGAILNSDGTDGQQATSNIAVPSTALEGNTRMRVIKNFNTSPTDSCGTYSYGQIEDYTINVSYPLSIADSSLLSNVQLYPNPISTNTFYINASSIKETTVSVKVNDILGREIYNVQHDVYNDKIQVKLDQNLNDGVYLVTISLKGMSRVFRVVKR